MFSDEDTERNQREIAIMSDNKRQQMQFRGGGNHGMGDHGQQGGGDRQGQMPEWFCPSCNTKNFETRSDCRRCRISKPVGVSPSVQNQPNPGTLGGNTVVPPPGPVGLPVTGSDAVVHVH